MTSKAYRVACNYVQGLLRAEADFSHGVESAIWYCQKRFPNIDFDQFLDRSLLQRELDELTQWYKCLLVESTPPHDLKILWYFLICDSSIDNSYAIDLCFAGDKRKELLRQGICAPKVPEYLPKKHLAQSKLLSFWAEKIDKLSFEERFLTEYVLGMTYASFVARDLSYIFAKEFPDYRKITVIAGFSLGDGIVLGEIKDGAFGLKK